MIHEDFWSRIDFLSGNVDSFYIVSLAFKLLLHPHSVSSIVLSRYGVFFVNENWSIRLLEKKAGCHPRINELHRGVRGNAPNGKNFEIFPGSNATNLYVYFVELFSESRYSWSLSRSTKIEDSQVIKQRFMILTCFVTITHDSWLHDSTPDSGVQYMWPSHGRSCSPTVHINVFLLFIQNISPILIG